MTSDAEEISPVAAAAAAAGVVDERIRSLSTASEASEDSAAALLPDVTFGPTSHTGMGSPRSNRESQPLLGARHEVDDFNHWPGAAPLQPIPITMGLASSLSVMGMVM